MACTAAGGIAAAVSRVVFVNSADAARPAGLQVQLSNGNESVYDTVSLTGAGPIYELWVSKDICRPGQGGSACSACALGTYSGGGNASTPKAGCLPCPSGFTTSLAGAQSTDMCTGLSPCVVACRQNDICLLATAALRVEGQHMPIQVQHIMLIAHPAGRMQCPCARPDRAGQTATPASKERMRLLPTPPRRGQAACPARPGSAPLEAAPPALLLAQVCGWRGRAAVCLVCVVCVWDSVRTQSSMHFEKLCIPE